MNPFRYLLFLFLFATTSGGYAQPVAVGIKGGVSLTAIASTASGSTITSDLWPRYHIGTFASFRFAKFSIQPEILYSRQGSREKGTAPVDEARVSLEYLSVPVLFKWHLPKGFNIQAGPQMSILLRSRLEIESGGSVASLDASDAIHQFDWAMCLGAEWESPFKLSAGGRYNLPMNNISKVDNTVMHNQVIQFYVGYKLFEFGKSL